jgi:hypothetical protein
MSNAALEEVLQEPDLPADDADISDVDRKSFRTPGFQRMRLDWRSDDRAVLSNVKTSAESRLLKEFPDAYRMLGRVYDIVRTPEVDEHGDPKRDFHGWPIWKRGLTGGYEEDFTRLTYKQKEDFLFAITTHLFEWQQLAADAWAEAMFAKAQWEERFSMGYEGPMSGTVQDRTASGRLDSREERYFALFMSLYSRKVDALVRSMELLGQRIKDSLVA